MRGSDLLRVIDQVGIRERGYFKIAVMLQRRPEHRQPVWQREGVLFLRIDADGHHQPVEESDPLLNHPEMTNRERIEASGVNAQSFPGSHSKIVPTEDAMSATQTRAADGGEAKGPPPSADAVSPR
jgi:hypothetical protein